MIKIENAKKTYNRHKTNEIVAINNTTLEFPEKGLVTLLGHSGSGKSTLLYSLAGMEDLDSGSVTVGDQTIKHYSDRKWSHVRNKHVGFIFQTYNLFEDKTVFENMEIALKLLGIKDKKEIELRINTALKSVMMEKYLNRKINTLSGGQQQRVGIARALAKNPVCIIADEPTGNLDSANSAEVMDILSKIAEEKLVVLVTHEVELADAYSDEIIYLRDGSVVDRKKNQKSKYKFHEDNILYLKDLKSKNYLDNKNVKLDVYQDQEINHNIDIKMVYRNSTLFVFAENDKKFDIRFADGDSDIKWVDAHFEESSRDLNDIDLESFAENPKRRGTPFKFFSEFIETVKEIQFTPIWKKIKYLPLIISGILIGASVSYIDATQHKEEINFVERSVEYMEVLSNTPLTLNDVNDILDFDSVEYFNPTQETTAIFNDKFKMTSNDTDLGISTRLSSIEDISEDLIAGSLPLNRNEIVIDYMLIEKMALSSELGLSRLTDYEYSGILGSKITFPTNNIEYTIVGIRSSHAPQIYVVTGELYQYAYNHMNNEEDVLIATESYFRDIRMVYGEMPKETYQVVYPYKFKEYLGLDEGDTVRVDGRNYTITGFYESYTDDYKTATEPLAIVTETQLQNAFFSHPREVNQAVAELKYFGDAYENERYVYYFAVNDMAQAEEDFQSIGLTGLNLYEANKEAFSPMFLEIYIFMIVSFLIAVGTFYFMIRSFLMSDIRGISIYKSLGISDLDIYKKYVFKAITLTTLFTVISYGIGLLATYNIQKSMTNSIVYNYSSQYMIYGFIIVLLMNIIFSVLPVTNILKRTPAQLVKHYDI